MVKRKRANPERYYSGMISFLSDYFPGVFFEYKLQKKVVNHDDYLDQSKQKNPFLKAIKRGFKLIANQICGNAKKAAERFVYASEDDYHKLIKAQYWQGDDTNWIYFMYLNPLVVVCSFIGGYQVLLIDIIFLYMV